MFLLVPACGDDTAPTETVPDDTDDDFVPPVEAENCINGIDDDGDGLIDCDDPSCGLSAACADEEEVCDNGIDDDDDGDFDCDDSDCDDFLSCAPPPGDLLQRDRRRR
jgi:hypothetical protein